MVDAKYFSGVGVGLLIAWVTSSIAYLRTGSSNPVLFKLIIFEIVVSVIMLTIGWLI